jgi:hypothetical protein
MFNESGFWKVTNELWNWLMEVLSDNIYVSLDLFVDRYVDNI